MKFLIARLKPGLYKISPLIHPAKPSEGNSVDTTQQQNIRSTWEKSLKSVATLRDKALLWSKKWDGRVNVIF